MLLPEEREALEHGKLWNLERLLQAIADYDLNLLVTLLNDKAIIRGQGQGQEEHTNEL